MKLMLIRFSCCKGTSKTPCRDFREGKKTEIYRKIPEFADNRIGYIMQKKSIFLILLLMAGIFGYAQGRPTSPDELIKTGVSFYSEGKFAEAAGILQLAGSSPEALYWLSLSELSAGNFTKALAHLNTLETQGSKNPWKTEIPYHRGRCLYYLGQHEEAIKNMNIYIGSLPETDNRRASAWYWQGESHLALGHLDGAAAAFSAVIDRYPSSVKYEASYYRLNTINQKKIEAELLALLKWSHEESLKSMEEYQEREKNYELAIAAYQKRIGELLSGADGAFAEGSAATYYQERLSAANRRIAELEESLRGSNLISGGMPELRHFTDSERLSMLRETREAAMELSAILNNMLIEAER